MKLIERRLKCRKQAGRSVWPLPSCTVAQLHHVVHLQDGMKASDSSCLESWAPQNKPWANRRLVPLLSHSAATSCALIWYVATIPAHSSLFLICETLSMRRHGRKSLLQGFWLLWYGNAFIIIFFLVINNQKEIMHLNLEEHLQVPETHLFNPKRFVSPACWQTHQKNSLETWKKHTFAYLTACSTPLWCH